MEPQSAGGGENIEAISALAVALVGALAAAVYYRQKLKEAQGGESESPRQSPRLRGLSQMELTETGGEVPNTYCQVQSLEARAARMGEAEEARSEREERQPLSLAAEDEPSAV